MYVRPPNSPNERIKIPENYRGNAFGLSGEYTDMPPPIKIPRLEHDLPPEEYQMKNAPMISGVKADSYDGADTDEDILSVPTDLQDSEPPMPTTQKTNAFSLPHQSDESSQNTIFSSLIPPKNNSTHFPFGHGIGAEELFLLGMMLLVFSHKGGSADDDNELIILLALLLFSG